MAFFEIDFNIVLFPLPEKPTTPSVSPEFTEKLTSSIIFFGSISTILFWYFPVKNIFSISLVVWKYARVPPNTVSNDIPDTINNFLLFYNFYGYFTRLLCLI